jgi:hypothetical protein
MTFDQTVLEDRKRAEKELDRITITETPNIPPLRRTLILGYVMGYAIGGLHALGVSDQTIRTVFEQCLAETRK